MLHNEPHGAEFLRS